MYDATAGGGLPVQVQVEDLSGLNKEAIRKTLALMRYTLEHGKTPGRKRALGFNQAEWYCGSAACLAGWIYIANGGKQPGRAAIPWEARKLLAPQMSYGSVLTGVLFSGIWHKACMQDGIAMLEWLEQQMTLPTFDDVTAAWADTLKEAGHV